MSKRHSAAIAIQAGACNPSGIAITIADACREIRNEGGDTKAITSDPAVRLMVHQLAFITGVISTTAELYQAPGFTECYRACSEQTQARPLPEGVEVVGLDDPAKLHSTLKRALGE